MDSGGLCSANVYHRSGYDRAVTTGVVDLVERVRVDRGLGPQLVETLHLPATESRFGELETPLPGELQAALARAGVERLWSHQVEALTVLLAGDDVLVTTPTASGKSLVFQLPVLKEAIAGGPGRALFLFPLKALGQDQKQKFNALAAAAGLGVADLAEIYDGDTPREDRQRIKQRPPRVLITNPDMLHLGILPHWGDWRVLFRDLRWIVLDELHTYRGIFGSHFHHVLERTLRLARLEGSRLQLIASSATVANAGEFAASLAGRDFTRVDSSGAPREGRHLMLFRPASSPYTLSLQLFVEVVEAGLKTIVFTKARRITELLYSWLGQQRPALAKRVASYRSGFLPKERRVIERKLFEGELDGVISTSALEMGVDIGGLDACILVGYPGSVMATWQRSGRVGRAGRDSITALVAQPDALDQYFLEHPLEFLERPFEQLIVDPLNPVISAAHLESAAAERPLDRRADAAYLTVHAPVVDRLLAEGRLLEAAEGEALAARDRYPQRRVALRGTSGTWSVVDRSSERVIGTVDEVRVYHECHPGAVYLHAGRQYLVRELDTQAGKALAEPLRVDYYTTPLTEKQTDILELLEHRRDGPLEAWLGRFRVTERVVGYERKLMRGRETIDQRSLDLPPMRFETVGLFWAAQPEIEETIKNAGEHFMGALHASEHAAISLMPILALCDRGDIGGISIPFHPQVGCGAVFVYDGHPGGVGIAARGFAELPVLLGRVEELLERCPCEAGCPSCIQSPKCGNGNRPLDKAGAARALRLWLGREEPLAASVAELSLSNETLPAPPPEPEPGSGVVDADGRGAASVSRSVGVTTPEPPAAPARAIAPPARPTTRRARRKVTDTVLFDLETRRSAEEVGGWEQAHRMRVAIGVACHLELGRFEVFEEERVGELVGLLESADLVVGFNVKEFDYGVLAGYTGVDYRRTLTTLDLLETVESALGFRLSLNHLAREALGSGKSADGLQSLDWAKEDRLDLVTDYCRKDVEILRDLYLFGRRMGYILYRDADDRQLKLPVDW